MVDFRQISNSADFWLKHSITVKLDICDVGRISAVLKLLQQNYFSATRPINCYVSENSAALDAHCYNGGNSTTL